MKPCEVCGCTTFDEKDGYLFCSSCCTQTQNYVDMEVETDGRILNKTVLADTTKTEKVELTSWEEYNYILVGLVNQLIELGANEELKLTTLQLWTLYLTNIEAAFFSKAEHELPRMSVAFKARDAAIMYDKKRPPRNKSKRKASTSRSCATERRKRQKQIIESEYNSSIYNVKDSTSVSSSIPLRFTKKARQVMKKIMPNSHITVHENSETRPKCHKISSRSMQRISEMEHMTAKILISITYIALNNINDKIQLGDILRWLREGHLSVMHIERFFPENYKLSRRMMEQMGNVAMMSHYRVRYNTFMLLNVLNLQMLNRPDFIQLCHRYVMELSLPLAVFRYVERLIRLYPPIMKVSSMYHSDVVPNFEGRAMAYIIFVLKLIFGLNGTTEELLSDSAENVNRKIGTLKLFNFRKWMHFVELRKIMLSENHFPTMLSAGTNSETYSQLYINHLKSIQRDGSEDLSSNIKQINPSKVIQPLFEAMFKATDIQQVYVDKKIKYRALKFHPSLQPNVDYLTHFLNKCDISTPALLYENFQHTEFDIFLKKNSLRRKLRETYGLSLKFREIKRKSINVNKNVSKHLFHRGIADVFEKYNKKCWVEVLRKKTKLTSFERKIENEIQSALNRVSGLNNTKQEAEVKLTNEYAKFLINENNYGFRYESVEPNLSDTENEEICEFDTDPEFVFEQNLNITNQMHPNQNKEANPQIFNNQSEDELSDDDWNDADEEIDFYLPNFHYWRRMCHSGKYLRHKYEKVERELPKSFNWLMHECARIIENKPYELYTELLAIEAGFTCFMKPLNKKTTRVKFGYCKPIHKNPPKYKIYLNHFRLNW